MVSNIFKFAETVRHLMFAVAWWHSLQSPISVILVRHFVFEPFRLEMHNTYFNDTSLPDRVSRDAQSEFENGFEIEIPTWNNTACQLTVLSLSDLKIQLIWWLTVLFQWYPRLLFFVYKKQNTVSMSTNCIIRLWVQFVDILTVL